MLVNLRLPEARARRARHARQLAPHALNSNSAHVFKITFHITKGIIIDVTVLS